MPSGSGLERSLFSAKRKCLVLRQKLYSEQDRIQYQKAKKAYARLLRKAGRRATMAEKKRGNDEIIFKSLKVVYEYWFQDRILRVREERTRQREAAKTVFARFVQNRQFVMTHAVLMRKTIKQNIIKKSKYFWDTWNHPFPVENRIVRKMMFEDKNHWKIKPFGSSRKYTISPDHRTASPFWCLGPCRVCGTHVVELEYSFYNRRDDIDDVTIESPKDYWVIFFYGKCCNQNCRFVHSLDQLLVHCHP